MKKRRILAIMMSVIMGIGMLAGCGKKEAEGGLEKTEENSEKKEGTSKKTDGEKKQITMWFWGAATDYQETMKNVLYSWYNDSQDEYELVLEFRNTVDTDIPVALAAGNGPDIVYASGPSYTSKYVEEDLVLNLDDYAEQYGWKDRVLSVMYDSLTLDGSLYSIPGGMCVGGLYYNKELFKKQGWEPPATWDEMMDLLDKAADLGIYPLGAGNKGWKPCNDHFSSMIINHYAGADLIYRVLAGEDSFDNPAMAEAVDITKEWYDKGYLSGEDYVNLDSQEVIQLLADERCAMVMAPTLYTQFVGQSFMGADVENVGFISMPSRNTEQAVYDVSINSNFSINSKTEYAEECAKILDYMLTSDFAVSMTKGWPGYWTTPIKEMSDYDGSDMSGLAKLSYESVQAAIKQIDQGYFAYHPATFFPAATLTAFEDVDTVWQGVVTPEDFCRTVAAELDAEIAGGKTCPLVEPKTD